MQRRRFLALGLSSGAALVLGGFPTALMARPDVQEFHPVSERDWDLGPLDRDAEDWRGVVSDEAWRILFRNGTERRYSSPLNDNEDNGTYVCAACHLPLFSSATQFESGTGWPSFWQPFRSHLDTRPDPGLFGERTEYHCIRCGGHQGHVFQDGPEPTGERWCNNGLALTFVPASESLPALRG